MFKKHDIPNISIEQLQSILNKTPSHMFVENCFACLSQRSEIMTDAIWLELNNFLVLMKPLVEYIDQTQQHRHEYSDLITLYRGLNEQSKKLVKPSSDSKNCRFFISPLFELFCIEDRRTFSKDDLSLMLSNLILILN